MSLVVTSDSDSDQPCSGRRSGPDRIAAAGRAAPGSAWVRVGSRLAECRKGSRGDENGTNEAA